MTLVPTADRPRRSSIAPDQTDARSKAVLFCVCGREASPQEWATEHDGSRRRLVCPDCRAILTVR
jgi:hypothetical protein